jgi:hypothetical protein
MATKRRIGLGLSLAGSLIAVSGLVFPLTVIYYWVDECGPGHLSCPKYTLPSYIWAQSGVRVLWQGMRIFPHYTVWDGTPGIVHLIYPFWFSLTPILLGIGLLFLSLLVASARWKLVSRALYFLLLALGGASLLFQLRNFVVIGGSPWRKSPFVPDFQGIAVAYSVLTAAYLLMLAGGVLMSMRQQDPSPL